MSSDDIVKFALQLRPSMVNALQAAFDFEKAMHKLQTRPGTSQESLNEVEPGVYTHVFTPPGMTMEDVARLLARIPDRADEDETGECEECGGPCRWEYADRYDAEDE